MTKQILITGGSGFIGQHLVDDWLKAGHQVVVFTRRPQWVVQRWQGRVLAVDSLARLNQSFDWLVNLAGEGIADQRWSNKRKQALRQSRVDLTRELLQWAQVSHQKFELVLSGSAVGYYGSYDNDAVQSQAFTEQNMQGRGFAAELCRDWEFAAMDFAELSERVVMLRTGIVLGANGGMLKRLWLPFSLGLGGKIGSGEQVLSWIHLQDYCRAVHFLCDHNITGPVNMTAPQAVTNQAFTMALASVVRRPALLPMPRLVATSLFGEMSELLLQGQRVRPQTLLQHGFEYDYADINAALQQIQANW